MTLDFSSDLAIPEADLSEAIKYQVAPDDPTYDPNAGTVDLGDYTEVALTCLRGKITNGEVMASNGTIMMTDVKFYIRDSELTASLTASEPKQTDHIEDSGEEQYRPIAWKLSPDNALWTIFARRIRRID